VLCADAAALRTSLDKLTHVTVGSGTANEIKADLTEVKNSLTTFADHARGQWQAQISALKTALGQLQTAVGSLAASPGTSTATGVATAVRGVGAAARDLLAAAGTHCPSASPAAGS
jgi:hypothetical protein